MKILCAFVVTAIIISLAVTLMSIVFKVIDKSDSTDLLIKM